MVESRVHGSFFPPFIGAWRYESKHASLSSAEDAVEALRIASKPPTVVKVFHE